VKQVKQSPGDQSLSALWAMSEPMAGNPGSSNPRESQRSRREVLVRDLQLSTLAYEGVEKDEYKIGETMDPMTAMRGGGEHAEKEDLHSSRSRKKETLGMPWRTASKNKDSQCGSPAPSKPDRQMGAAEKVGVLTCPYKKVRKNRSLQWGGEGLEGLAYPQAKKGCGLGIHFFEVQR